MRRSPAHSPVIVTAHCLYVLPRTASTYMCSHTLPVCVVVHTGSVWDTGSAWEYTGSGAYRHCVGVRTMCGRTYRQCVGVQQAVCGRTYRLKKTIRSENRRRQDIFAKDLYPHLTPNQKRSVDLTSQKGASSWLIALLLSEHGFFLNKGEFRDAICLRYNWELKNTPTHCGCGNIYSTDHAMICHTGGFPTHRHNEIRDITATLLTDVCHNVSVEPLLQPLSGESLHYRTSNVEDDARPDIRPRGFWSNAQDAFFDVRVFHPNASSN